MAFLEKFAESSIFFAGFKIPLSSLLECMVEFPELFYSIIRLLRVHKYCSLSYSHLMATRKQSSEGEERDMR